MALPMILGTSIYQFIVNVCTIISSLFALTGTILSLMPTTAYMETWVEFSNARQAWREFDKEDSKLSPTRRKQYTTIMNSVLADIRALDFIGKPTRNIFTLLRAISKSRKVRALARDAKTLRVAALTLSTQRRHIRNEQKKMDEGGAFVNLAPLEKRFHKQGALYADWFGDRKIDPATVNTEAIGNPNATRASGTMGRDNIRLHTRLNAVVQPPENSASVVGHRSNSEILSRY
ncbi:hypothetical protein HYPSUDRAFT_195995 [Hypholoma sublateritium FD-334 SS-4]|uniref:Uncharacterized protein n=1 Tax=Hypholoma sublateritium (strain FD-334 SS-4) TaxID=945553 RepID=A0A0D2LNI8_HYPSF|nr:hypothetical protein HYPSUDRAFT_195995 [Hypholoma sublateritium FD-334 SS-4]